MGECSGRGECDVPYALAAPPSACVCDYGFAGAGCELSATVGVGDVCGRMLTYTDVCGRMLTSYRRRWVRETMRIATYADVCGRMRTYADVC